MNPHYNQKYSRKQVETILQTIQDCVRHDRYIISKNENRTENIEFIHNYNLTSAKQKNILLRIKPDDFCTHCRTQKLDLSMKHYTFFVHRYCCLISMAQKNWWIFT